MLLFIFFVLEERHPNGTLLKVLKCVECGPGMEPSPGNECIPCSKDKISERSTKCSCPADFSNIRGMCVPMNILKDWPDERSSYVITFENGKKIDSKFLRDYLLQAISMCKVSSRNAVA